MNMAMEIGGKEELFNHCLFVPLDPPIVAFRHQLKVLLNQDCGPQSHEGAAGI